METQVKENYSFIEIYGAEKVLNMALNEHFGYDDINEELFVDGGLLNSTSDANGYPIEFEEGKKFSHCFILDNGMLVAVCYDDNEEESFWRVEPDNLTELKNF